MPKIKAPSASNAKEFSELALWSILGHVELLASMTGSNVPELILPENIGLLLRVAMETRTQNQVLAHKALQAVLSLDAMNGDILEESVTRAQS